MDLNENPVTELVRPQNNGLLVGARGLVTSVGRRARLQRPSRGISVEETKNDYNPRPGSRRVRRGP